MKRKKRTWVRGCGRWGVWVCTGLLVVAIPVSLWVRPNPYLLYSATDLRYDGNVYVIRLTDGRIRLVRNIFWQNYILPDDPGTDLVRVGWRAGYSTYESKSEHSWWSLGSYELPFNSNGIWHIDIPVVYLFVVMFGWSYCLIRGQRKFRRSDGCCIGCGYSLEGLTSDVCPECGEKYA
jgi:hypothetical protein